MIESIASLKTKTRNIYYILFSLLVIGFQSGCASVPSASLADPNAEIPANAGIVAVQVVSNAEQLSPYIKHWEEVIVMRLSDQKVLTIPSTGSGFVSTRAFVGALPPGQYVIVALFTQRRTSDFIYTMSAQVSRMAGNFEIKQGQMTNLGTLIFQPFDEASKSGKSVAYLVSRIPDSARLIDLVRTQFPQQYAQLSTAQPLGWLPDSQENLRQEISQQVRKAAVATVVEPDSASESFWLLGRLGQVYKRGENGSWTRFSLTTPYQLTALATMKDGTAIVGGERGVLFRVNQQDQSADSLPFSHQDSNIVDVGQFLTGDIFVLSEKADSFHLLTSPDGQTWKEATTIAKQQPGWLANAYNIYTVSFPYVMQKGNTLQLWIDNKLIRYDAVTNSTSSAPSIEFSRLHRQGNGILVGREYSSWSGEKPPQYSTDDGTSWKKVSIGEGMFSTAVGMPYIFTDGSLIKTGSAREFKLWESEWVEKDQIPLLQSSDGGKTWQPYSALPKRCDSLSHAASTDNFLVTICRDGRVLTSRDKGSTWKHEFGSTPQQSDYPDVYQQAEQQPST